ncbi:MAG TPA: tetratricopeptide repeat protein [Terriglobales bacterium]|nr:tetratricopeptide repeat protein [Terriglobales bacterium]
MGIFFPILRYGFILQAIAIVHFIRRRPEGFWLWIIILGGGFGALVYIVAEVIPDLGLLRGTFRFFPRRQRIHELEAMVQENPSAGNYEELGGLYLDDGNFARARECFDRAISSRTDSPDPFYRRALAELELKDLAAAAADLERVVSREANYDFHRAAGLLAYSYWRTGKIAQADALFARVTQVSTSTEIQFYYASFLASQGRTAEAREWVDRIMAKQRAMPGFQRRRERPWVRQAAALMRQLSRAGAASAPSL